MCNFQVLLRDFLIHKLVGKPFQIKANSFQHFFVSLLKSVMKLTFFFITVCFAVANQSLITSIMKPLLNTLDKDFVNFLLKYSKIYDVNEILEREAAFLKCLSKIKSHNSDYDKRLVSYTLKENKFCDLFDSERQRLSTGNRNPPYEFADFMVKRKSVGTVNKAMYPAGPASFDWTTTNCISPVKDQGYYCNNCWAFSSIASLEAHWCIKTGQAVSLSEQQAVDCNRNPQTGNWGCDGGSPASCFMYIYGNDGIQNDTTYPYQERTAHSGTYSCKYSREKRTATTCGYWRIRPLDEDLLKNVIAGSGPVAAGMYADLDTFCMLTL